MGRSFRFCLFAAVSAVIWTAGASGIRAAEGGNLALNCDNGRAYPIHAKAVSDAGELVTGYIYTAPRKAHYFRLVPMGNGYRYAGQGFWFDGIRGEATLDIGSRAAACTVDFD